MNLKYKKIVCVFVLTISVYVSGIAISSKYNENTAVFMPLNNRVIAIDAGHGGWDPGKTGKTGMNEKDINLDIANKLCTFLEDAGAEVYLTRPSDDALGKTKSKDMKERIDIIKNSEADIMISIHQNAFPKPNAKGAQSFYFKQSQDGKLLAECIQKSLIQSLDEKNSRVAKENNNYYILKNTQIPSVIIECGFLSNPDEETKLNNEDYRLKTAWAIFDGIRTYFDEKDAEFVIN